MITRSHLQRLRPVSELIARFAPALPFLLGPLMLNLPADAHALWLIARGYIAFVFLILSWAFFVRYCIRYLLNEKSGQGALKSFSSLLLLIACGSLLLVAVSLFRHTTSGSEFYLGLCLLPLSLVIRYVQFRQRYQLLIPLLLFYYTLAGSVSFLLVTFEIFLEAVALSLAVAALCCLPGAISACKASFIESSGNSPGLDKRFRSLTRTVIFVALIPLITLGFLNFTYSLSTIYSIVFISAWPAYHLLKILDSSVKEGGSQDYAGLFGGVDLHAGNYVAAFIAFLVLSRMIEWIYVAVVVARQY